MIEGIVANIDMPLPSAPEAISVNGAAPEEIDVP